MFHKCN